MTDKEQKMQKLINEFAKSEPVCFCECDAFCIYCEGLDYELTTEEPEIDNPHKLYHKKDCPWIRSLELKTV